MRKRKKLDPEPSKLMEDEERPGGPMEKISLPTVERSVTHWVVTSGNKYSTETGDRDRDREKEIIYSICFSFYKLFFTPTILFIYFFILRRFRKG